MTHMFGGTEKNHKICTEDGRSSGRHSKKTLQSQLRTRRGHRRAKNFTKVPKYSAKLSETSLNIFTGLKSTVIPRLTSDPANEFFG
jgi:hypothetical protein